MIEYISKENYPLSPLEIWMLGWNTELGFDLIDYMQL